MVSQGQLTISLLAYLVSKVSLLFSETQLVRLKQYISSTGSCLKKEKKKFHTHLNSFTTAKLHVQEKPKICTSYRKRKGFCQNKQKPKKKSLSFELQKALNNYASTGL